MPGQMDQSGGLPGSGTVTLAMLADLATDRLLGRVSSGTGVPEAVTFTDFGQSLVDDATAAAGRATLVLPASWAAFGGRCLRTSMNSTVLFTLISDTAYFVYQGRVGEDITVKHVEFAVTTGGAGTQAAEVALYSSPLAPNKAGQTLTRLGSGDGTLSNLTGTGVMRNTTTLAQAVPAGTHLWAAIRTAMSVSQPVLAGLTRDYSQGHILAQTTSGALTSLASATGALIAHAITAQCPDLSVVID